jgi:hypothetical protein
MKRKNDENCVVANMYTVFWFNKQNEFVNDLDSRFKIPPRIKKKFEQIVLYFNFRCKKTFQRIFFRRITIYLHTVCNIMCCSIVEKGVEVL